MLASTAEAMAAKPCGSAEQGWPMQQLENSETRANFSKPKGDAKIVSTNCPAI
jgi:hypothetical protein